MARSNGGGEVVRSAAVNPVGGTGREKWRSPSGRVSVVLLRREVLTGATMVVMEQVIELVIGDAEPVGYVVEERRADGRIVLRPETEVERMHRVNGSRPATDAEFAEFVAEHGQHMLPPDGEG